MSRHGGKRITGSNAQLRFASKVGTVPHKVKRSLKGSVCLLLSSNVRFWPLAAGHIAEIGDV
jgi:hypothetical protein